MRFLKENWVWIALPIVIVLGGLLAFILLTPEDDGASPFVYNIDGGISAPLFR